jgi:hypothetical protein
MICGPEEEQETWRIRTNQELYKILDIVKVKVKVFRYKPDVALGVPVG